MSFETCGVGNPDVPSMHCELPANHGRVKELWFQGCWYDHLSRSADAWWVIPPNDERDEAIAQSIAAAATESVDFIDILTTALSANGYEIRRKPNAPPTNGAHAGS